MTLLTNIKDAQLTARKAHDNVATALLTTLYSEAAMVGKNATPSHESTDAEVTAVIRKFLKNTREYMDIMGDRREGDVVDRLHAEEQILEQFLPQQMTELELEKCIATFMHANGLSGPKALGLVMKMLKEQHGGQYDGQLASAVAKRLVGG